MHDKLIERINRKDWWHVPSWDPQSYEKRGIFLASTFRGAEFWGRPLDEPQRVAETRVGKAETFSPIIRFFRSATKPPLSASAATVFIKDYFLFIGQQNISLYIFNIPF